MPTYPTLQIEAISSQGTAERQEDGLILIPPGVFGVFDGFSAPYSDMHPPTLFDRMSGGEMVREVVLRTFYSATSHSSLRELILEANRIVGETQIARGIPIDRADLLAGASFVFVRIGSESVEIIQAGDCLAVCAYTSSEIGVTKNQVYFHEIEALRAIAELMDKHRGDRGKMWVDFVPVLSSLRQRDINQRSIKTGYAALNGQPALRECWQETRVSTAGLRLLLLFSDGLVSFPETAGGRNTAMAKRLVSDYKERGLGYILRERRKQEEKDAERAYIARAEATAIAISF